MKKNIFCTIAVLSCLTSCTKNESVRGSYISDIEIKKIQIGKSKKQDVLVNLGTPYLQENNDTWLYLSRKESQSVFRNPKTIEEANYKVSFDSKGILKGVEKLNLIAEESTKNTKFTSLKEELPTHQK